MYNLVFKYKKTTQSTNTMAYNCVQYTYALDDGGSTGGNAGDTLYVYSYTDYDPMGLPLAGRSFTSHAYRYGYQGQFAEYDPESGLNNFELRQYDAALGRWFVPDPYRQHHSPYMAMGNSWVKSIDADGGWDYDGPLENHTPGYRRRLQYYYKHPNFMKGYPEWARQRAIYYLEHANEINANMLSGSPELKDRPQRETVGPDIYGIRQQLMWEGYSLTEANAYINAAYGRTYNTDNCVYVNGGFYYPYLTYNMEGETDGRVYLYPNEDGSGQGFSVTRTEYDAIKTWAGQGMGGDYLHTVRNKETLSSIADWNGCSVKELKNLNHLRSDKIHVGQKLITPTGNEVQKILEKQDVIDPKTQQLVKVKDTDYGKYYQDRWNWFNNMNSYTCRGSGVPFLNAVPDDGNLNLIFSWEQWNGLDIQTKIDQYQRFSAPGSNPYNRQMEFFNRK